MRAHNCRWWACQGHSSVLDLRTSRIRPEATKMYFFLFVLSLPHLIISVEVDNAKDRVPGVVNIIVIPPQVAMLSNWFIVWIVTWREQHQSTISTDNNQAPLIDLGNWIKTCQYIYLSLRIPFWELDPKLTQASEPPQCFKYLQVYIINWRSWAEFRNFLRRFVFVFVE